MSTCPICGKYDATESVVKLSERWRKMAHPEPPPDPITSQGTILLFLGSLFAFGLLANVIEKCGSQGCIVTVLLFGIPGVCLIGLGIYNHSREKARWRVKKEKWAADMEVWKTLYYCYTDDIVFNKDGVQIPADDLPLFWHKHK